MQLTWLVRKQLSTCLIFFSGWGMDPTPFSGLDWGRRDVLMAYDYQSVTGIDLKDLTRTYKYLEVQAWSLGVAVAARLLADQPPPRQAVAIGGTLAGIGEHTGIAPGRFQETLDNFSPAWLNTFYRSMFDDPEETRVFLSRRPHRNPEGLYRELIRLQHFCSDRKLPPDPFTNRIILSRDRIIPARNQKRSWSQSRYRVISAPHFPFYRIQPAKLLNLQDD